MEEQFIRDTKRRVCVDCYKEGHKNYDEDVKLVKIYMIGYQYYSIYKYLCRVHRDIYSEHNYKLREE